MTEPDWINGFWLGDWHVRPSLNQLASADRTVDIDPLPMRMLVRLARGAGGLVTTDALIADVWDGRAAGESTVDKCMDQLRKALGDQAHNPTCIQTIANQGYRVLAAVSAQPPLAEGATIATTNAISTSNTFLTYVDELRNRKVFRAAALYAVGAWIVLQVAEVTFDPLGLPDWAMRAVIMLALIGFPVALVLAWLLQVTPDGVVVDLPFSRSRPRSHPTRQRYDGLLIGALVVAIGLGAFAVFRDLSAPTDPAASDSAMVAPSIAVLAFENFSKVADSNYLSDGLSDEVINLLSRIAGLNVAARTSSFAFRDAGLDVAAIADRLQVRYVLEGSVARDEDRLRVIIRLVDAQTGFNIWNDTYERNVRDLFSLQSEIAEDVVGSLKLVLSGEDAASLRAQPTESIEAYTFYLQALELLRRPSRQETLEEALRFFQRAVDIDSGYAQAYAGKCEAHMALYELNSDTASFEAAERACHRALTLDSSQVAVHVALGTLYRMSGQYSEAQNELERAIAIDDQALEAWVALGETFADAKRTDQAEAALRHAIDLKPGDWRGYGALGYFLYSNERYAEAATNMERVTILVPDGSPGYNTLGAAHYMEGDFAAAADAWGVSLKLAPNRTAYTNMGLTYYYLARFRDAVEMQIKATELAPEDHRVWGRLADAYRFLPGESDAEQAAYAMAIDLAEKRLSINPRDWNTLGLVSSYYSRTGNMALARDRLAKALAFAGGDPTAHYYAALVYLELNEIDQTFFQLREAVAMGFSRRLLDDEPDFQVFDEDPRFREILIGSD